MAFTCNKHEVVCEHLEHNTHGVLFGLGVRKFSNVCMCQVNDGDESPHLQHHACSYFFLCFLFLFWSCCNL